MPDSSIKQFNAVIDELRAELTYVDSFEDARQMVNKVREYQYKMLAIDFEDAYKRKFLKKVKKL